MFAMLKNAIAAAVKSIQTSQVEKHIASMKKEQSFEEALKASNTKAIQRSVTPTATKRFVQTKGDFQFYHLEELKSTRVANAICSLGCWIALAKGFGAYTTVKTAKNAELIHSRTIDSFEQFWGWNVGHRCEEQLVMGMPQMVDPTMGEESIRDVLIKLSYVTPMAAKGPALEALKVLARVKGVSVESLVEQRNKRAEEQTVAKMEAIDKFITELLGFASYGVDDEEPKVKLDLDKVLNKVEQTLGWVASWNTSTEAGQLTQVSELILIEGDLNYLKTLTPAGDDGARFVDKVLPTVDSMSYREDWDFRAGTTSSRGDGRSRNVD